MDEITINGESPDYRKHRNGLLQAEAALKDLREQVAEFRRQLPLGAPLLTDYVFMEGPKDLEDDDPAHFFETKFSTLFEEGKDDLIIDHLMFALKAEKACPMCSMWADGYNAMAPQLTSKVNFVLVARAPLEKLRAWAKKRGWHNLRLLSSANNTFNSDFNVEITPERQLPAISVFQRTPEGRIHHFYTTEASLSETHHRGIDLFNPVWHFFDLLPNGREDWMPEDARHLSCQSCS